MFSEQTFKLITAAQTRFTRFLRVCGGLNKPAIIFPLALLIFATLGCRMLQTSPHKSDVELTAEFQQNKEKFNRLVTMVKEDKTDVTIYLIEAGSIKTMSNSRIAEYKRLMEDLSLRVISLNQNKKQAEHVTRIQFNSTNFVKQGEFDCKYIENKGFVWYETGKQPANREVKNLDREHIKGRDVTAESRIDDNWSLYYTYETCFHD